MSTWKWLLRPVFCSLIAVIGQLHAEPPQAHKAPQLVAQRDPIAAHANKEWRLWRDTPQKYMRLHHRLSLPSKNWPISAEEIGDSGDAFTLFLMKRKILKNITPVEVVLRKGIIERIEKRRGPNHDQIRLEEVGFLLNNAIYQDPVLCNPTQHVMIKWLQQQFRDQIGDPRMRSQLIKFRDELHRAAPTNNSDEDELFWLPSEQMRRFLDELLLTERTPTPSKKP